MFSRISLNVIIYFFSSQRSFYCFYFLFFSYFWKFLVQITFFSVKLRSFFLNISDWEISVPLLWFILFSLTSSFSIHKAVIVLELVKVFIEVDVEFIQIFWIVGNVGFCFKVVIIKCLIHRLWFLGLIILDLIKHFWYIRLLLRWIKIRIFLSFRFMESIIKLCRASLKIYPLWRCL